MLFVGNAHGSSMLPRARVHSLHQFFSHVSRVLQPASVIMFLSTWREVTISVLLLRLAAVAPSAIANILQRGRTCCCLNKSTAASLGTAVRLSRSLLRVRQESPSGASQSSYCLPACSRRPGEPQRCEPARQLPASVSSARAAAREWRWNDQAPVYDAANGPRRRKPTWNGSSAISTAA